MLTTTGASGTFVCGEADDGGPEAVRPLAAGHARGPKSAPPQNKRAGSTNLLSTCRSSTHSTRFFSSSQALLPFYDYHSSLHGRAAPSRRFTRATSNPDSQRMHTPTLAAKLAKTNHVSNSGSNSANLGANSTNFGPSEAGLRLMMLARAAFLAPSLEVELADLLLSGSANNRGC